MRHLHASRVNGVYDDSALLSEQGQLQLGYTLDVLRLCKPEIILCSQATRALEPALISQELGIPIYASRAFSEYPNEQERPHKDDQSCHFGLSTNLQILAQIKILDSFIITGYRRLFLIGHHHRLLQLKTYFLKERVDRDHYKSLYYGNRLNNGGMLKFSQEAEYKTGRLRWVEDAWSSHLPAQLQTS